MNRRARAILLTAGLLLSGGCAAGATDASGPSDFDAQTCSELFSNAEGGDETNLAFLVAVSQAARADDYDLRMAGQAAKTAALSLSPGPGNTFRSLGQDLGRACNAL